MLRRLRLTRLQPHPHNPKRDEAAGKPLEIWFEDEARVGQQDTYGAVWNEIGSRPAVARDDRYDSA